MEKWDVCMVKKLLLQPRSCLSSFLFLHIPDIAFGLFFKNIKANLSGEQIQKSTGIITI